MENRALTGRSPISVEPAVQLAITNGTPVVALETAVVTHGLPYPRSLELARRMEVTVREGGAVPATIAVIGGRIKIGVDDAELAELAQSRSNMKIGPRDFARAAVERASGGTTVAATMFAAHRAGIIVFATGGIGGVHKENRLDISADLGALATTAMVVVCSGAKAILDLAATLEWLEMTSVPVVGYQTDEFPAFYSRDSGLGVSVRLDSVRAIAEYWAAHRSLGMTGAVLVANPIPESSAIPYAQMEPLLKEASRQARGQALRGKTLTPFLLESVSALSEGRSLIANEALLLSNARLAAEISTAIQSKES